MRTNKTESKLLRETRDTVIRLDEHMKSIDMKLDRLPCYVHNKRITSLEHWKVQVLAIAGTISALVSFIVKIIHEKLKGG